MLNPAEADLQLRLAVQLNPGPWEQHSISVAENGLITILYAFQAITYLSAIY